MLQKVLRKKVSPNLVPRVSHLTALGGKMRDPGNEVGFLLDKVIKKLARHSQIVQSGSTFSTFSSAACM